METNRRTFLKSTAAAGAIMAVASAASADTPKKGGHLAVGLEGAAASNSLDPATYDATYMYTLGCQIFNTLTEMDENGKVLPSLAQSWDAKPGAAEWVLKLRKDVQFSNGKSLTAKDVIYSLNHHRGKDSKSGAKIYLEPVSDLKETAPDEVTITLQQGNADFPVLLADYHFCITQDGAKFEDAIGTGCFTLENFEPGVRALTKRNTNYWNTARGFVDSVETIAINDPTARISALRSGSIQLMNRVDAKLVSQIKSSTNLQIFDTPGGSFRCFPMRCDTAPYNNNDTRLALKYAIDREAILKQVARGHGTVGNDHPIPPFDPFFAADVPQRPYDPDKAKFHMKKSGYDGPIELFASDGAYVGALDAAQVFQASAQKAGINVVIQRAPADGYWKDVWLQKPFCASNWGLRPTADLMFSIAFLSSAPWNETYWKRPDFDALVLSARSELDESKRRQMYHDLQLMLTDEGGEIIPVFANYLAGAASNLRGYVPIPRWDVSGYRAPEKVWFA